MCYQHSRCWASPPCTWIVSCPKGGKTGRNKKPDQCCPSARGQVMAWRSLLGFVQNCKVLLRDCELQPSVCLDLGEPSAGICRQSTEAPLSSPSPGRTWAWEMQGFTCENEDARSLMVPRGPSCQVSFVKETEGYRLEKKKHRDFFQDVSISAIAEESFSVAGFLLAMNIQFSDAHNHRHFSSFLSSAHIHLLAPGSRGSGLPGNQHAILPVRRDQGPPQKSNKNSLSLYFSVAMGHQVSPSRQKVNNTLN